LCHGIPGTAHGFLRFVDTSVLHIVDGRPIRLQIIITTPILERLRSNRRQSRYALTKNYLKKDAVYLELGDI
jgi:hypothetical protein